MGENGMAARTLVTNKAGSPEQIAAGRQPSFFHLACLDTAYTGSYNRPQAAQVPTVFLRATDAHILKIVVTTTPIHIYIAATAADYRGDNRSYDSVVTAIIIGAVVTATIKGVFSPR